MRYGDMAARRIAQTVTDAVGFGPTHPQHSHALNIAYRSALRAFAEMAAGMSDGRGRFVNGEWIHETETIDAPYGRKADGTPKELSDV